MKKTIVILALSATAITVFALGRKNKEKDKEAQPAFEMTSQIDSLSYAIGISIASNIQANFDTLNTEALSAAFADSYAGDDATKMNPEDATAYVNDYFMGQVAEEAGKNLVQSEAFLSENKEKEGVLTTETGLQYKIIEEGTGKTPSANSQVEVHYRGTLIDGTEFDSSFKRGETAKFGVGQVIPGWTEGLQLMQEGAVYEFYIHPDLAYGERAPESIGPNQALIFEVKLVQVIE